MRKTTASKPKKKTIKKAVKILSRARKKTAQPRPVKTKAAPSYSTFQLLRGMKDILPSEAPYWQFLQKKIEELAEHFGYQFIETPILEKRDLFIRGVGRQTDIVEKEMYVFTDPGGENVCLRPEATASIARAYIEHGMLNLPQPVKLYYFGLMFRHDRPQAGRLRQFHQAGFEALGSDHSVIDAELIAAAFTFFRDIGISASIQLNSIGCASCRETFKSELITYYRSKKSLLCQNCRDRLARNPLRLLDCKEPGCEIVKEAAPQVLNFLDEACQGHFFKVVEYLDELGLPYSVNPFLVRGLDYYNRTVFEIWPDKKEAEEGQRDKEEEEREGKSPAQASLGGGGRYDGLVELLGGKQTPAVGFAIGLERVISQMKEQGLPSPKPASPQVFIAQLGEPAKRKALKLCGLLAGQIKAAAALSKDSLKAQLEIANRLDVRFAVIIGQKEVMDETVIVRDMEAGVQEIIPYKKIAQDLKRRLGLT